MANIMKSPAFLGSVASPVHGAELGLDIEELGLLVALLLELTGLLGGGVSPELSLQAANSLEGVGELAAIKILNLLVDPGNQILD